MGRRRGARVRAAGRLLLLFWAGGCAPRAVPMGDASGAAAGMHFEVLRRFVAPEARQAVAADGTYVYAIDDRRIGKYHADSGARVAVWADADGGRFVHLNSGVVIDGLLYAAHSNYPATPMRSSIEVFDAETLAPVDSRDLGVTDGSATWVDRRDGRWWVAFAHYAGRGGVPGKGPPDTRLVAFDDAWTERAVYRFPDAVVSRFGDESCSGGAFGPDGLLYATGHDAAELYVLRVPAADPGAAGAAAAASVLELVAVVPVEATGQGIAWDPLREGVLYTIRRAAREVVVSRRRSP